MRKCWSGNGLPFSLDFHFMSLTFMEVKVFGSTRGNNYKSICAQCNLKRKKKSDPSRRNKRKYIFVPAAWATQALSRQCWNLPKTVHTLLQCNHSPASASPLPPHAQVYQQESTRTQEPYLHVVTQKCHGLKMATRWMDPMAFIWQFCPSAERKMRPHVPSAVLAGGNEIWISWHC